MSRIPRAGGNKPLIKNTSTVTSKTPTGGSKTVTTTKIRELQPCTAGAQSRSQSGGCQPCPSQAGQRSIRPPQAISGIRRPGAQAPAPSTRDQPGRAPPRRAPPAQRIPPGEYNVPAQFGPMSRGGKGMTFSSPPALRGQMEARVPKEIKYDAVKTCPYTGEKKRGALQGTKMADTLAGSFNVYGGPSVSEEIVDRNILDQRHSQFVNMKAYDG